MDAMRVDHVSYASEPDGLRATAARLSKLIGVGAIDGGVHPRFGTRNIIIPLAKDHYVEVVEVLDHPASDKAPFGQAVRARSLEGDSKRIREWLGPQESFDKEDIDFTFVAPHGQPGLLSVTFDTAEGLVTV